jgi:NDP-sugar pyrophosphorylase family protein
MMQTKSDITLLILAAGLGSRFGGDKQLEIVGQNNETLMDYAIFDAAKAGFTKVVFVIRKSFETYFKSYILPKYANLIEVNYVLQEINDLPGNFSIPEKRQKPWGTGQALLSARNEIKNHFVSINADDYYGREAFVMMANGLKNTQTNKQALMIAYKLKNTLSKHGTVSRGICQVDENQILKEITEHTKIFRKHNKIYSALKDETTVLLAQNAITSMNFFGFSPDIFDEINNCFKQFLSKNSNHLSAEFYLPWAVSELNKNRKIELKVQVTDEQWMGMTYEQDKSEVINKLKALTKTGFYPAKLFK